MFVVVSYDIPEDKRRTRIMKTLKNYGCRVQYSVFECELKAPAYRRLRERLNRLIAPKDDNVRFYFLDEDGVKRIEAIGVAQVQRVKESYIIG